MLNDYHLQFLHRLTDSGARFLVIGGQARRVHDGSKTRDLDIWVDIGPQSRRALETVLLAWSAAHPLHTAQPLTAPLALRPNVQIQFPDADCSYMTRAGIPAQILATDRIDILTSVDEHDFEQFHARAFMHSVDGMELAVLSREDVPVISPSGVARACASR
jgi:hypothetical protein